MSIKIASTTVIKFNGFSLNCKNPTNFHIHEWMRKSYADRISMSTRKLREKVKFIHQVFLILVKIFFTTRGANVSSREFIFTHRLVFVNVIPGNIVCSLLISAIVRIFLSSLSLYFLFFTTIYYKYSYFFTERVWIFNQCLVFILCGSKKKLSVN